MTHDTKDIRAFLAIALAGPVLQAVEREQEKLKKEISGRITWTKSAGQHLTLKFFDNISLTDVENIGLVVRKHTGCIFPFSLSVEKLGVFPDSRKPRVLWSNIAGHIGELTALHDALNADFEAIGFARDHRPYKPHLTLARIKTLQMTGGIEPVLGRHNHFQAGEFIVRELILFQSRLEPRGASYFKLAAFPLGG